MMQTKMLKKHTNFVYATNKLVSGDLSKSSKMVFTISVTANYRKDLIFKQKEQIIVIDSTTATVIL